MGYWTDLIKKTTVAGTNETAIYDGGVSDIADRFRRATLAALKTALSLGPLATASSPLSIANGGVASTGAQLLEIYSVIPLPPHTTGDAFIYTGPPTSDVVSGAIRYDGTKWVNI